jgi:hypothetical protein
VDRRSGKVVSSIDSRAMSFVIVKIDAQDACDPKPVVESVIGTETKDGDTLRLQGQTGQLTLKAGQISLKVSATDASGNVALKTQLLSVSGQSAN